MSGWVPAPSKWGCVFVATHLPHMKPEQGREPVNWTRNLRHHLQITKIHQEDSEITAIKETQAHPGWVSFLQEEHTAQVERFVPLHRRRWVFFVVELREIHRRVRFGKFMTSGIQLGRDSWSLDFFWKIFFSWVDCWDFVFVDGFCFMESLCQPLSSL